jgi:putative salt-induced outer membrane protein YdiY
MFRASFAAVALLCAGISAADVVIMNNGDQLSGRLDSITAGVAILDTPYAGRVRIEVSQIQSLQTDEAFDVSLPTGKAKGVFVAVRDGIGLQNPSSVQTFTPTDIRSATQRKNELTRFAAQWGTRLDLALSLADGNTTAEAYNVLLEADYANELNAHAITTLLAREEGEGLVTRDQLSVDYGYKRFVSDRWFAAANAKYFQDPLKDIDSRITLGAGVGVQFIDTSLENLNSDLGVSAVREDIGADTEVRPALRWSLDYQRFLAAKTLELFHRQSILQLLEGEKNQVIASSTGLRYAYSERIDTTFRIDLAYESDPPLDNKKTDTTYSLGVGIKF